MTVLTYAAYAVLLAATLGTVFGCLAWVVDTLNDPADDQPRTPAHRTLVDGDEAVARAEVAEWQGGAVTALVFAVLYLACVASCTILADRANRRQP